MESFGQFCGRKKHQHLSLDAARCLSDAKCIMDPVAFWNGFVDSVIREETDPVHLERYSNLYAEASAGEQIGNFAGNIGNFFGDIGRGFRQTRGDWNAQYGQGDAQYGQGNARLLSQYQQLQQQLSQLSQTALQAGLGSNFGQYLRVLMGQVEQAKQQVANGNMNTSGQNQVAAQPNVPPTAPAATPAAGAAATDSQSAQPATAARPTTPGILQPGMSGYNQMLQQAQAAGPMRTPGMDAAHQQQAKADQQQQAKSARQTELAQMKQALASNPNDEKLKQDIAKLSQELGVAA